MKTFSIIFLIFCHIVISSCVNKNNKNQETRDTAGLAVEESAIRGADSLLDCPSKIFDLKGNYKLCVYTLADESEIYRLVGNDIDTIIADFSAIMAAHSGYTGIDFDDYFAISWYQYYQLYEKQTGKQVWDTRQSGYNTEHNLMLRYPEEGGALMLLNLKTGKEVDIYDYYPEKVNDEGAIEVWQITNVTDEFVNLLNDTGVSPINVRIPKSEIE